MIDFVTLVFNHPIEIELLKLQATSFQYCDSELVGKIFIFYNDTGNNNIEFLKDYYPKNLFSKVNIIYRDNISDKYEKSSWRNQQYFKLYISNYVKSKYYVILDGKNHFIRKVNLNDFIKNDKPKLYLDNPGQMIKYYRNCLKYFKIKDPYKYKYNDDNSKAIGNRILLTTTPYIFITKQVKNMINHIESKEKESFYNFFMKNTSITEFYLYSTYLIFSNNIDKHEMVQLDNFVVTIFDNPNVDWNKYNNKKHAITDPKVKVFGLHRMAVENIDNNYKNNLLTLYSNFFDKKTCVIIKSFITKGDIKFIHIGKCCGTSIKRIFKDKIGYKNSYHLNRKYKNNEKYIIWIRNPLKRFVSSFYYSYNLINTDISNLNKNNLNFDNCLCPFRIRKKIENNGITFSERYDYLIKYFKTANHLAESISSDSEKKNLALELMNYGNSCHIYKGIGWYLYNGDFIEENHRKIIFVGSCENFKDDVNTLSKVININSNTNLKLRNNIINSKDKFLSKKAIDNLLNFYKNTDYMALKKLVKYNFISKNLFDEYYKYNI